MLTVARTRRRIDSRPPVAFYYSFPVPFNYSGRFPGPLLFEAAINFVFFGGLIWSMIADQSGLLVSLPRLWLVWLLCLLIGPRSPADSQG